MSHVDAAQEGIKAAFLRDLDLQTFPVSRSRQWLLTDVGAVRWLNHTGLTGILLLLTPTNRMMIIWSTVILTPLETDATCKLPEATPPN